MNSGIKEQISAYVKISGNRQTVQDTRRVSGHRYEKYSLQSVLTLSKSYILSPDVQVSLIGDYLHPV